MKPKQWVDKFMHKTETPAAMWLGHNRDNVTNGLSIATALMPLLPRRGTGRLIPIVARVVIGAAGTGTSLAVARGRIAHDKNLCEPCLAEMPLDGPAQAEEHKQELRIFHRLHDDRRMSLALTAPNVLGLAAWKIKSRKAGVAAYLVLAAPDIYLARLRRTHFRLEPWCPQCHPDGDIKVRDDIPDPVGSGLM